MKCPKCGQEMDPKVYDGVEVDRCFSCGGIFLDKGEMETVIAKNIGNLVDFQGTFEKAKQMDRVVAHCHRCDQDMVVLRAGPDIRFDRCLQCEGSFFDRGELAALNLFQVQEEEKDP